MKMLKASVVIMGIAIIIGVGVLAVMWIDKMRSGKPAKMVIVPSAESPLSVGLVPELPGKKAEEGAMEEVPDAENAPPVDVADAAPETVEPIPAPNVQAAPTPTPAPAAVHPAPQEPTSILIPIPAGSRVVSTSSSNAFMDVLVENADGSRDIYTIERATGRVSPPIRFR